ncbi:MAG: hypothetical protein ABW146_05665 [Candidatus Sedimenticola sp. 6PFRAG7]
MNEQLRRVESEPSKTKSNDTDRKLWVVATLAFWVSLAITIATLVVTGKINLVLASITLGTMILGIWLKARYQLKQRKDGDHSNDST